ncbi:MAG TPA: right-handed parallel beta-helix repeat-containing protein [Candidatus Blautia stercoravium]|nr:right-handed parallel beta-helix repeat-containing protein [Candidatus Blautia stercoravium]
MEGRSFYLDSEYGNDACSGLSPKEAWRTLAPANATRFYPGDRICFRAGGVWKGCFAPKGSGSRFAPVKAEPYGEGAAPRIDGEGGYAAVLLDGVSFWSVEGLEITNRSSVRAVRQGICICGKPEGITEGITVRNCRIHDVTGENRRAREVYQSMYWNGAIYVTMPGRSSKQSHLQDILIEKNQIYDVTTSGIRVNQQEDFINDIHHTHVVVRGNQISRTGSDGIIVANCISPLIDANVCLDAGANGTLEDTQLIAGIWVCATRDALIQYNEVAGTRLFENDGTAFDTDWGTAGTTIFQYNYTHDNEGGFWLDCMGLNYNRECEGTILRYNVSVNDGRGIGIYDQGLPADFYGNVFCYEKDPPQICVYGEAKHYCFENNQFLFDEPQGGWKSAFYAGNRWSGGAKEPRNPGKEDGIPEEIWKFYKKHLTVKQRERLEECCKKNEEVG